MKLYPAILTDSIKTLQQQVNRLKENDDIKVVQVDVIDGNFADNMTVTAADLILIDWGDLKVDFHLMVEGPLDYLQEILELKEHLPIRAVLGQIEQMSDPCVFIKKIKSEKIKAGLSLDIFTPVSVLSDYEIGQQAQCNPDLIQLMGIEAGFQGQKIKQHVFTKLQDLKNWQQHWDLKQEIVVDGGVKLEHVKQLKKQGAKAVVVGSLLWEARNLQEIVTTITKI